MHENSWNNPDEYGCAIEKLLEVRQDVKFLFLIPSSSNELLRRKLNRYNIRKEQYIIENPDFEQVPILLSQADIGLYILDNNSIRIGTKFVEYCSAGLPTIVNQNIKGAAELIQDNNLGRVISLSFNKNGIYCPDKELPKNDFERINSLFSNKKEISTNCRQFAKENFDTHKVAEEYAEIY